MMLVSAPAAVLLLLLLLSVILSLAAAAAGGASAMLTLQSLRSLRHSSSIAHAATARSEAVGCSANAACNPAV
jgi:hypothetical protein